ncbi:MAG: glycosyltransferase [Patescibacteria group bacterium]|nr:glycosyltransferase [Patescibacteria group bacterium]MDE2116369.1 glycosyltransferase [Patescibacteria group bacterium]
MRFSIVTPTWNSEKYIRETLESVSSQTGDFDIEHIIVDGGSTDGTLDIVREYESTARSGRIPIRCRSISVSVISEKDEGMYDAVNKGFAQATGDVFAWLNSDDTYEPGAFDAVARAFAAFPETRWLKGRTTIVADDGSIIPGSCRLYRQDWIREGIYGREAYFIEQDSVFWRADLWKAAGGIPHSFKRAGDYYLWIKFGDKAPLVSLDAAVSRFRKRPGQLSKDVEEYRREQIITRPERSAAARKARRFFALQSRIVYRWPVFEPVFLWLYRSIFGLRGARYLALDDGLVVARDFKSYKVY